MSAVRPASFNADSVRSAAVEPSFIGTVVADSHSVSFPSEPGPITEIVAESSWASSAVLVSVAAIVDVAAWPDVVVVASVPGEMSSALPEAVSAPCAAASDAVLSAVDAVSVAASAPLCPAADPAPASSVWEAETMASWPVPSARAATGTCVQARAMLRKAARSLCAVGWLFIRMLHAPSIPDAEAKQQGWETGA